MSTDEQVPAAERLLKHPNVSDYSALLECPVCYELIIPPVYPCSLGHNLCNNCKANVKTCPICRSFYANCRNVFLEKLLDDCRVTCKYNALGCESFLRGKDLTEHELDCDFRPVLCFDCNRLVRYDEFIQHLKDEKKTNVMRGSSYRTAFDLSADGIADSKRCDHIWRCAWLRCLGNDFFLRMESDGTDWWVFLTVFGTKEEASEWSCEIAAFNTKKKISASYNGPVNPVRARGDQAANLGQCLSLSKSFLAAFKNDKNELEVGIKLYRGQAQVPPVVEPCPSSSSDESLCQGSKDQKHEPYLMGNDYQTPPVTYQNIAIPLFAIVSLPSTQYPGKVQTRGQHRNSTRTAFPVNGNGQTPVERRRAEAMEYFGANLGHQTDPGNGDATVSPLPPRDSLGAIVGSRLGRLVRSINPAVLAAPITPRTEMNLYNMGPPVQMPSQSTNPIRPTSPDGYYLFPPSPRYPRPSHQSPAATNSPSPAGPSRRISQTNHRSPHGDPFQAALHGQSFSAQNLNSHLHYYDPFRQEGA